MDSANAKSSLNFDFNSNNLLNAIKNNNGDNNDFENLNLNSDDSDMADTSFEVRTKPRIINVFKLKYDVKIANNIESNPSNML